MLATAEFGEADGDKRPSVQVGDPFAEKKLMECSLELLERGLLVALQDLGAAGLTSSSSEMASKGGVGIDLDVGRVPLREADMEPFEIMVSESQERMLCVCRARAPGRRARPVRALGGARHGDRRGHRHAAHAHLPRRRTGRRHSRRRARRRLPGLRAGAPGARRAALRAARGDAGHGRAVHEALLALLASPNLASRRPLFEQYDSIVQSRTVRRPEEADAAVLALPDGGALGVAIDGNGRRVAADPYQGTIAAMLECAANLACVGAEPLGVTNNLNFGNPEKPHIAWQLTEAVRGLGDACRALEVPVTGGNVSLYNESAPSGPIYPTPVIGMVGRLPDAARAGRLGFARAGDAIALAGWDAAPSLAASELAKLWGEPLPDGLPAVDLGRRARCSRRCATPCAPAR